MKKTLNKILLVIPFTFFSCNADDFESYHCSEKFNNMVTKLQQQIDTTKSRTSYTHPVPEIPSSRWREVYGKVLLDFKVNESGKAEEVQIIEACPKRLLIKKALKTIESYKFAPATKEPYQGVVLMTFDK